jgi:hypothetical protein
MVLENDDDLLGFGCEDVVKGVNEPPTAMAIDDALLDSGDEGENSKENTVSRKRLKKTHVFSPPGIYIVNIHLCIHIYIYMNVYVCISMYLIHIDI